MWHQDVKLIENHRNGINDRYGSRRGLLRVLWHKIVYALGYYHEYRNIDWSRVNRLVFVCKGNICRSPFAETVANAAGLNAVSCGIAAGNGVPANIGAIEAASRKGLDLAHHKARTIDSIQLMDGDLFVAMEPCHLRHIKMKFGNKTGSTLLGLWYVHKYPYIPDPYGATSRYFDHCFALIEKSVLEISNEIKKAKID